MAQHNQFFDGVFSEATSLTHLLDTGEEEDHNEAQISKHSAYYDGKIFQTVKLRKTGLSF